MVEGSFCKLSPSFRPLLGRKTTQERDREFQSRPTTESRHCRLDRWQHRTAMRSTLLNTKDSWHFQLAWLGKETCIFIDSGGKLMKIQVCFPFLFPNFQFFGSSFVNLSKENQKMLSDKNTSSSNFQLRTDRPHRRWLISFFSYEQSQQDNFFKSCLDRT